MQQADSDAARVRARSNDGGIFASHLFARPEFDGAASVGIALVLAATAMFLARETKGLLMGESAHPHVKASILRIAGNDVAVAHALGGAGARDPSRLSTL
jgi:hypothetical protein